MLNNTNKDYFALYNEDIVKFLHTQTYNMSIREMHLFK